MSPPLISRFRMPIRPPTWWVCSTLLKFGLIAHFVFSRIGTFAPTEGPSMVPTMSVRDDWYYISKSYRRGRDIKVGDVINFKHPMAEGVEAIKRVLGMPGDFVCTGERGRKMIQVPEGHCWLLGDNLTESRDSRIYGPIPLALVKGKIVARVWPLSEVGWVKNALQRPEDAI
ncbi:hypothetical protein P7C71_g6058, partial [Lecanoromycetidae sp. Uapishka_2]